MGVLWVFIGFCAIFSAAAVVVAFRRQASLRRLAYLSAEGVGRWPRVSVIMAARNEAERIGPALASRLTDDYPNLELILVDDRSTDATMDEALRAAPAGSKLHVVRVNELPHGWLGKVNALEQGTRAASGDYLLFSDADVSVTPGTVRRAVALCERESIDCLGLVPEYQSDSLLVSAAWIVFIRALFLVLNPRKLRDSASPNAVLGSGAFTLVRRSAFDRTPGFAHLRMETGDDMALAAMMKSAGGHCEGVMGAGCASVKTYDSPADFLKGIEKNGSTTAASPWTSAAGVIAFAAIDLAPVVALLAGPVWLRALALACAVVSWIGNVAILRSTCRTSAPALLWPFGTLLFAYGMLRSTALTLLRGGVNWRGTFYPLADLEAGRRYTL